MDVHEYRRRDAVGLAALIAQGEVGAAEVLEAAIAVADAVDRKLGAIVLRMDGLARDRVRESLTGPLAGVPFLIKDMNHDYAGLPTAAGSRALREVPAAEHAEVVRRWLAPGSEGLLIRLAGQLEAARPWAGRSPAAFPRTVPKAAAAF